MSGIEFYHHGILGMKWGKRNGPPYPLGAEDHSISEKKAGWRKSLDNNSESSNNNRKGLTAGQKKVLKIGVAFVGAGVAAYTSYRLIKSGKLDAVIEKGKNFVSSSKTNLKVTGMSDALEFKKLSSNESAAEVLCHVNPTKSDCNCFNTVVAVPLRLCGINATAKGDTRDGKGLSFDDICRVFKLKSDSDITRMYQPTAERIVNHIEQKYRQGVYKEGDMGALAVSWNKTYNRLFNIAPETTQSHTLNWLIKDGQTMLLDGQVGKGHEYMFDKLSEFLDTNKEVSIARFANIYDGIDLERDVDKELLTNFVK